MIADEPPSARLQRACDYLKASGQLVSLTSLSRTADRLDGRPLAQTTILRDPRSAEIYHANRNWRAGPKRKQAGLFADLPEDLRHHAINLLARKKEVLVRLIIACEAEKAHHQAELQYLRGLEQCRALELPARPVDAEAQLGNLHALLSCGRTYEGKYRPASANRGVFGGSSDAE